MTVERLTAPTGFRFEPLPDTPEAFAFSFSAKCEALGPHIRARWPWDEEFQRRTHRQRLSEKPFFVISHDDVAIGTLSWTVHPDHARFGEFYLFERYQGQGFGTLILVHMLTLADKARLPVRLEYLKWNPVGRLYRRHGFLPTRENETHMFLERPSITPR
jgi:GNAT superfamily N-acetyltransferase